jgi:ubiquinol-cytochrome c reductase cytochrome c subunit
MTELQNDRQRERRGLGRRTTLALCAASLAAALPLGILAAPSLASGAGAPRPVLRQAASPIGQDLYEERCATCHGSDAQGTEQGPPIAGLGPAYWDFMMSTGRMPLDQPDVQAKRRPPVLTPVEIHAITDYLETIPPGDGEPIPSVNTSDGDLSLGEETYQENCAPCHGITGRGGAVGPQIAPPVVHANAVQVAEAIRIGPGTMPVFDENTIDQDTLDSVVAYVEYLRRPDDRGGSGLGGVGPLIEGFVALVGGLGLIVLVTRMIGTRA